MGVNLAVCKMFWKVHDFGFHGPAEGSPSEITGGRAGLGLAQMSFFHWKPLAQLPKQPITVTSLFITVLLKVSSSFLQVVVLKF